MSEMAAQASKLGAHLILFPEGALTGYLLTEEFLGGVPTADGKEAEQVKKLARKTGLVVATGLLERTKAGVHVSHFVAFPDGKFLVERKHILNHKELNAHLVPGDEKKKIFTLNGVKLAVCICADTGLPNIDNKLAARGCQVMLAPSAGGAGREYMCHAEDLEDPAKRKAYLESMEKVCFVGHTIDRAVRHHMAYVAVNLSGDDGVSNYHPGHCFIVDGRGHLIEFVPGEYVVEFLRPRLIHVEIEALKPRVSD
jgi:predicted amidohydrolase